MRESKLTKITYGLDDIGIRQSPICYTEHRGDINPYVTVCGREMYPIFASPMESVIDENNYKIFIENKITPVIPRSIMQRCSIEDRLKLSEETFVSFSEKEVYDIFEKGISIATICPISLITSCNLDKSLNITFFEYQSKMSTASL